MAISWLIGSKCLLPVRHVSGLMDNRGIEDRVRALKALYSVDMKVEMLLCGLDKRGHPPAVS